MSKQSKLYKKRMIAESQKITKTWQDTAEAASSSARLEL